MRNIVVGKDAIAKNAVVALFSSDEPTMIHHNMILIGVDAITMDNGGSVDDTVMQFAIRCQQLNFAIDSLVRDNRTRRGDSHRPSIDGKNSAGNWTSRTSIRPTKYSCSN